MSEQITWAGRMLSGTDRFGEWITTNLDGWFDSPEVKGDAVEREGQDGEFDLPIQHRARLVTVSGHFRAAGHEQLHDAMNHFGAPTVGRFTVAGHGPVMWADGKRNSGVKFTPITDTLAQWQVGLKFVDPRKYGNSKTFVLDAGATVQVHHRGNYGAMPKFVIRGDAPSYTLTINGWNYAVSKALQTGKPHRIDYANGKLYVNGALTQNSLGNTNVTTIPPGASVGCGLFLTAGGTGSADMTVTDTYI